MEEAPYGTTVNIVAPGRVQTESFEGASIDSSEKAGMVFTTPLVRAVTGADVGETVAFYASDAAACITGQTIYIASGEIIP